MTTSSDGQLLAAYAAGDASAFATLVQTHQAALLRHARAILGNRSTYEDVVQEAFLKLAQKPPSLAREVLGDAKLERAQLSSWLHTVTRNLCMDVARSEIRRKRREQEAAAVESADGGLAVIDQSDTRSVVEKQLNRLPSEQREVLVLRLLGERSYKEIAEITGKKIGTVGWLVSVGLKTLSRELAPILGGVSGNGNEQTNAGPGLAQGGLS